MHQALFTDSAALTFHDARAPFSESMRQRQHPASQHLLLVCPFRNAKHTRENIAGLQILDGAAVAPKHEEIGAVRPHAHCQRGDVDHPFTASPLPTDNAHIRPKKDALRPIWRKQPRNCRLRPRDAGLSKKRHPQRPVEPDSKQGAWSICTPHPNQGGRQGLWPTLLGSPPPRSPIPTAGVQPSKGGDRPLG